ncbi:MAG TPA: VOC family protein [Steroidobacteraceae bacterium]|nr:VOC family protein [Steroidobacteraceae bacterium]
MAQGAFVWYELMTGDVGAAKKFYGSVVGWTTQDMPMPGMTYTIFSIGTTQVGGMMTLPKEAAAGGMPPTWISYVHVDDVDAAATKAQRLGGKICVPATDIPGVGRFASIMDPLGAAFNLFKPNQAGERGSTLEPGQVGWHELHTSDQAKVFEFYRSMFGWSKGDTVDMGPMGTYQLFKIGDLAVGGMFNSPAAQAARFWLYYFVVTDIDAAKRRVTDGGGTVTNGPVQVPGGTWIVQATDPQGAAFALVGPRK